MDKLDRIPGHKKHIIVVIPYRMVTHRLGQMLISGH